MTRVVAVMGEPAGGARAWLARHWLELAIVTLGVTLRWTMRTNYDYRWSYDFADHVVFIRWVADTFSLPPIDLTREAYHPPLYYFIAGTVMRLGAGESRLGTISIVCGILRLLILWAVFTRWLGPSSLATHVALLVAAVQPTSIHLDGMATGEGLSNLGAAAVMWLVPPLFRRGPATSWATWPLPWRRAVAVGVLLGLALLTKISALSIILALALAAAAQLIWTLLDAGPIAPPSRAPALRRTVAIWLTVAAVALACSGWYLARNHRHYGKLFLSGFDGPDKVLMDEVSKTPLLARRPLSYFTCWSNDIYRNPYYPSGVGPISCFWPQLIDSTWVDFYRYGFSNGQGEGALRTPIIQTARASVAGGTVLSLCVSVTTLLLLGWAWRRRDAAAFALLIMPVIALGGQLYFATAFPVDSQGMVKGLYMQFASPPLYGVVGFAAGWLWRARLGRPIALALVACVALVGSYSMACRFLPPPAVRPGAPG